MSTTPSNTSSSGSSSSAPYDQWKQWAQKQRNSRRQEAQELIYAEDECDQQIQHHMELPHKKRASLLDDDDDDECDAQAAPWKVLPKVARKSLLDDDDDEEEATPPPPRGADVLFLPPTELRRSDDRTDRLLTMHMLSTAEGNNISTRSLSLLPAKGRSKHSSFDATAPLSMITALSSRRQYNQVARNV